MRSRREAPPPLHPAAEAAAKRQAALIAALSQPPGALEAALRAIGTQGSPPLLAALSAGGHGLLRAAALHKRFGALAAVLRSYGGARDACAPLLPLLCADDHRMLCTALRYAHDEDAPAAVEAILGAYRAGGGGARAVEALADNSHYALRRACGYRGAADRVYLLLQEYHAHGGAAAVLAALEPGGHQALSRAVDSGDPALVATLASAYPPGHPALRAALAADGGAAILAALDDPDPDMASSLLEALGQEPGCGCDEGGDGGGGDAAARLMAGVLRRHPERLRELAPDSHLARLAVQTPAAWAALGDRTARALLSAPSREALALPPLLALKRLPPGVARPVSAYLHARPWLLFVPAPLRFKDFCVQM